ncbi:hypothetical protein FB451DRAFT_1365799 [Mycena latifolia]|nr:hypothetical protein FB451DRAFT_1365799 [Mycena latifolia]
MAFWPADLFLRASPVDFLGFLLLSLKSRIESAYSAQEFASLALSQRVEGALMPRAQAHSQRRPIASRQSNVLAAAASEPTCPRRPRGSVGHAAPLPGRGGHRPPANRLQPGALAPRALAPPARAQHRCPAHGETVHLSAAVKSRLELSESTAVHRKTRRYINFKLPWSNAQHYQNGAMLDVRPEQGSMEKQSQKGWRSDGFKWLAALST